jgi:predicted DNA-binding transcriptional regulator YafY
MAIYGDRVAGLPRMLQVLYYHPRGMWFADLATEVGQPEADVRETLRIYYLTDLAHYLPDLVARPEVLEFFGDGNEDPLTAPMVRLVANDPGTELGVAYTSASELARMYRLAYDASLLDRSNEVLASAVQKLHAGLLPSLQIVKPEPWDQLSDVQAAIEDCRRVRLVYARAREPVIEHLVVEPYWLIRTHRGWELDACSVSDGDRLRTFIVSNVRELEVLSEAFVPPAELSHVIKRYRAEIAVILDVPHDARWAVDKYAERVELVEDRVDSARLRVHLLPPARVRVGLMLMVGGPSARVVEPADLAGAGGEAARRMLRRYETDDWTIGSHLDADVWLEAD